MEPKRKYSKADFQFLEILGRGAYGRVVRAQKKDKGEEVAIKIVEKAHLQKENKTRQAHTERNVLIKLHSHPGIVRLQSAFHDSQSLYFVLEFCPHGELLGLINCFGSQFPRELAQIYIAEIVNILDFMQQKSIVHRDLKPENLLIGRDYHLRLTDFGTALDLREGSDQRGTTFVGTAEYISPEVINDDNVGFGADIWALGIIIYQLYAGSVPFRGQSEYQIFEKIKSVEFQMPESIPEQAADLIQKILVQEPELRLGAGPAGSEYDIDHLKQHPFFDGINIDNIFQQEVPQFDAPQNFRRQSEDDLEIEILNRNTSSSNILVGLLKKRAWWLRFKRRRLEISSEPRIQYFDPVTNELKGTVPLSENVRAEIVSQNEFQIIVAHRTYDFRCINDEPQVWVDAINRLIFDNFRRS